MKSCWSLKLSECRFLILLIVALPSFAQFSKPEEPALKGRAGSAYLFPVNPGQPNSLAGTMGELRSTHFHAGIDVRTNNMTGVPIRSTQSGYISRVTVSSYGYGKSIFVTHPDGNTSVYGHLDGYRGPIADYILQQHYQRKSFDLDLNFSPTEFPVKQGDTIAVSGNTGGSNGAHLHFEIRDENNLALNPLQFGFTEVQDHAAPIAIKVALKTVDQNARINDRFGRFEFSLVKRGDQYVLPFPILAKGIIAIELLAHDKLEIKSAFRTGINTIEATANGERFFFQQIDKINFEASRAIVRVMDYQALKAKGARYNKLYIDDGNPLAFYPNRDRKGWVRVDDKDVDVSIKLTDFSGHESNVVFTLKSNPIIKAVSTLPQKTRTEYDIIDNTMIITSPAGIDSTATVYKDGQSQNLPSAYRSRQNFVHLLNLQKILPDSIKVSNEILKFNFIAKIPSATDYTYYSDDVDIQFPDGALYDTLFLALRHDMDSAAQRITIGDRLTPLHSPINVTVKNFLKPRDSKTALYRGESGRYALVPSAWNGNHLKFSTRELGEFTLKRDTIAPTISRLHLSAAAARFRIRDNLAGIAYFEATINGEWVLMHYDYKTGILHSEKLDRKKPFKGDFVLRVVDGVGNEKIYQQTVL